jgi:hypothetical protein
MLFSKGQKKKAVVDKRCKDCMENLLGKQQQHQQRQLKAKKRKQPEHDGDEANVTNKQQTVAEVQQSHGSPPIQLRPTKLQES